MTDHEIKVGDIRESRTPRDGADTEYERLARDVHAHLIRQQGLTAEVKHNVEILGRSGQWHQLDVYWSYRVGGVATRVALECKNYQRRVGVALVREMIGLRDDVPGLIPVIVTKEGYQRGAMTLARASGIGLRLVRSAHDDDYAGRIRTIVLEMTLVTAGLESIEIGLDQSWVTANLSTEDQQLVKGRRGAKADEVVIVDIETTRRCNLNDLLQVLPLEERADEEPGAVRTFEFDWPNAFLEVPGFPRSKVNFVTFSYRRNTATSISQVGGEDIAHTIVKDALEDKMLFIDERGVITGDRDELM